MFSRVAPSIFVTDLDRAVGFYRDVLGFTFECVDDPPVRAVVRDANAVLHLDSAPSKAGSSRVHMIVADLDEVCALLRRGGVEFIQPPTVQPWGLRDIHVADPDGNVLELAEPVTKISTR